MHESVPESFANPEDLPKYMLNNYMLEVRREDSLQNVYIERLSQIIEDGNLEKVSPKIYWWEF